MRIEIRGVSDIVAARQSGRTVALNLGFSRTDATLIATAISELARNMVLYAGTGEIRLTLSNSADRRGIVIVGSDNGPGIPDVERALLGGYSTSGGLGIGLCGVKRMMDEFEIDSRPNRGTTIVTRKWLI